jgi:hypothetical protein
MALAPDYFNVDIAMTNINAPLILGRVGDWDFTTYEFHVFDAGIPVDLTVYNAINMEGEDSKGQPVGPLPIYDWADYRDIDIDNIESDIWPDHTIREQLEDGRFVVRFDTTFFAHSGRYHYCQWKFDMNPNPLIVQSTSEQSAIIYMTTKVLRDYNELVPQQQAYMSEYMLLIEDLNSLYQVYRTNTGAQVSDLIEELNGILAQVSDDIIDLQAKIGDPGDTTGDSLFAELHAYLIAVQAAVDYFTANTPFSHDEAFNLVESTGRNLVQNGNFQLGQGWGWNLHSMYPKDVSWLLSQRLKFNTNDEKPNTPILELTRLNNDAKDNFNAPSDVIYVGNIAKTKQVPSDDPDNPGDITVANELSLEYSFASVGTVAPVAILANAKTVFEVRWFTTRPTSLGDVPDWTHRVKISNATNRETAGAVTYVPTGHGYTGGVDMINEHFLIDIPQDVDVNYAIVMPVFTTDDIVASEYNVVPAYQYTPTSLSWLYTEINLHEGTNKTGYHPAPQDAGTSNSDVEVIFVDQGNSDDGTGTPANPYHSLPMALTRLRNDSNDRFAVFTMPGDYTSQHTSEYDWNFSIQEDYQQVLDSNAISLSSKRFAELVIAGVNGDGDLQTTVPNATTVLPQISTIYTGYITGSVEISGIDFVRTPRTSLTLSAQTIYDGAITVVDCNSVGVVYNRYGNTQDLRQVADGNSQTVAKAYAAVTNVTNSNVFLDSNYINAQRVNIVTAENSSTTASGTVSDRFSMQKIVQDSGSRTSVDGRDVLGTVDYFDVLSAGNPDQAVPGVNTMVVSPNHIGYDASLDGGNTSNAYPTTPKDTNIVAAEGAYVKTTIDAHHHDHDDSKLASLKTNNITASGTDSSVAGLRFYNGDTIGVKAGGKMIVRYANAISTSAPISAATFGDDSRSGDVYSRRDIRTGPTNAVYAGGYYDLHDGSIADSNAWRARWTRAETNGWGIYSKDGRHNISVHDNHNVYIPNRTDGRDSRGISFEHYAGFINDDIFVNTTNKVLISMLGCTDTEIQFGHAGDAHEWGGLTANGLVKYSRHSLKKNFEHKDEEDYIEMLRNTDVVEFNYKTEEEDVKPHVGIIINDDDESPYKIDENLYNDKDKVATDDLVGVTMASVKYLDNKVKEQQATIDLLMARLEALENK